MDVWTSLEDFPTVVKRVLQNLFTWYKWSNPSLIKISWACDLYERVVLTGGLCDFTVVDRYSGKNHRPVHVSIRATGELCPGPTEHRPAMLASPQLAGTSSTWTYCSVENCHKTSLCIRKATVKHAVISQPLVNFENINKFVCYNVNIYFWEVLLMVDSLSMD